MQVALKRVGNVLESLDYAKRMLREVCILRRLDHPNVIKLLDVFMKPSPTGRFLYRRGRLVPTSYDIYLALEYCDQAGPRERERLAWEALPRCRSGHVSMRTCMRVCDLKGSIARGGGACASVKYATHKLPPYFVSLLACTRPAAVAHSGRPVQPARAAARA